MKVINFYDAQVGELLPPTCSFFNNANITLLDTCAENIACFPDSLIRSTKIFTKGEPINDGVDHGLEMLQIFYKILCIYKIDKSVKIHLGKIISKNSGGTQKSFIAGVDWARNNDSNILIIPSGIIARPCDELKQSLRKYIFETNGLVIAPVGNLYFGQTQPLYPAVWKDIVSVGCLEDQQAYLKWHIKPDFIVNTEKALQYFNVQSNVSTSVATMIMAGVVVYNSLVL